MSDTIHFSSFIENFCSKEPHRILSACDNAYLTLGSYGEGWTLSVQIREPKIGDTVTATWETLDNERIIGVFQVENVDNELMITASLTSDYITPNDICRWTNIYGYRNHSAYIRQIIRDTVKADDYVF